MRLRPLLSGLLVALIALALDQFSKYYMLHIVDIANRPPIQVTPFFDLVMVWNYGVSFGMFAAQNQPLMLAALSAVIMLILLIWLLRTPSRLVACALGSVMGGASGNVIDRLRFGAVADFLDFHIGNLHWPAFNIADSAIFIGVVVLCIHGMFIEPRQTTKGSSQ